MFSPLVVVHQLVGKGAQGIAPAAAAGVRVAAQRCGRVLGLDQFQQGLRVLADVGLVGAGQTLGQIERDAHFMGDAGLEGIRLVSLDAAVQFHNLPRIVLVLGLDLVVVGIGCKPLFNGCVKCFLRYCTDEFQEKR